MIYYVEASTGTHSQSGQISQGIRSYEVRTLMLAKAQPRSEENELHRGMAQYKDVAALSHDTARCLLFC